ADLFSLGVVLYAACAGASPFRAETPFLTLDRVRRAEPAPLGQLDPSLPDWFCTAVQRLLRKDPADRIPSAAELAELLERPRSAATLTVPGDTVRTAAPGPSPPRFRRWWAAALVGPLVLAALGLPRYLRQPKEDFPPPDRPPPTGFVLGGNPPGYHQ